MSSRLLLYNLTLVTLAVLTLPWVIYQLAFVKKRRRGLSQRLGRLPAAEGKTVWCHAVSVGEVRAIKPMLSLLQEDGRTRNRIVLSTVTETGQETAQRECGSVNSIFYFPLDLPFVVSRAVTRINPEVFVTAETEIWPNFYAVCFRRSIPIILVNGRISDSSFSRYMRFRWLFGPVLEKVAMFLMQSDEDARRIVAMGARPETVEVTGNMKYDRAPETVPLPDAVIRWSRGGPLLVAGSTHAGEEEIILQSIGSLEDEGVHLALVPRHPERFDEVARLLEGENVPFTRYSDIFDGSPITGRVVLVDAMGVLDGFYGLADIAFVGGSLVPVGGHNLLEPAAHGVAILTGPHLHNFRDIAGSLVENGGCFVCEDSESISAALVRFLKNRDELSDAGERAKSVYGSARGASLENTRQILSLLEDRQCTDTAAHGY